MSNENTELRFTLTLDDQKFVASANVSSVTADNVTASLDKLNIKSAEVGKTNTAVTGSINDLNNRLTQAREILNALPPSSSKYEASLRRVNNLQNLLSRSQQSGTNNMNRFGAASGQTSYALMNMNRIVSDAPFGFIAISNNIGPMVDSFQAVAASAGGVKAGFASLVSAATGPLGIATAITFATSALTYFALQSNTTKEKTKELKDEIKELKNEFDKLTKSQLEQRLAEEKNSLLELTKEYQSKYGDRSEFLKALPLGVGNLFSGFAELDEDEQKRYNATVNRIKALEQLASRMGYIMDLENQLFQIEEKKKLLPKGLEHIYDAEIVRLRNLIDETKVQPEVKIKIDKEDAKKQVKEVVESLYSEITFDDYTIFEDAFSNVEALESVLTDMDFLIERIQTLPEALKSEDAKEDIQFLVESLSEYQSGLIDIETLSQRISNIRNKTNEYEENATENAEKQKKFAEQTLDAFYELGNVLRKIGGDEDSLISQIGRLVQSFIEIYDKISLMEKDEMSPTAGTLGIVGPILQLFGAYDNGGVVGTSNHKVAVDPSVFSNAPHFSTGGIVGRPIIAHDDEVILNPTQAANILYRLATNNAYANNAINQGVQKIEVYGESSFRAGRFVTQFDSARSKRDRMVRTIRVS